MPFDATNDSRTVFVPRTNFPVVDVYIGELLLSKYSKITAVLIGNFKLKGRHKQETGLKKLNNSLLKWTPIQGTSVFGSTEFYLDIHADSREIELSTEVLEGAACLTAELLFF